MNTKSDNNQQNSPKEGGASDISAKKLINTHGSGEPSDDNVNVKAYDGEEYKSNTDDDSDPKKGGASDISAKEEINTHGSGEPSADNVNV